jgi:EAL domain-containing protein (putative c-di-GMP-specific phosphodiesterase class I)
VPRFVSLFGFNYFYHSKPLSGRISENISALRNQETIAEYIKTLEDVKVLTEIGITYGQGYYLGKPKPLTEWLNFS